MLCFFNSTNRQVREIWRGGTNPGYFFSNLRDFKYDGRLVQHARFGKKKVCSIASKKHSHLHANKACWQIANTSTWCRKFYQIATLIYWLQYNNKVLRSQLRAWQTFCVHKLGKCLASSLARSVCLQCISKHEIIKWWGSNASPITFTLLSVGASVKRGVDRVAQQRVLLNTF